MLVTVTVTVVVVVVEVEVEVVTVTVVLVEVVEVEVEVEEVAPRHGSSEPPSLGRDGAMARCGRPSAAPRLLHSCAMHSGVGRGAMQLLSGTKLSGPSTSHACEACCQQLVRCQK